MTSFSIPQQPIGTLARLWYLIASLPWYAIKTYPPVFLLASSAAYASSQFAAHHTVFPSPFNIMLAVSFELVYLGAISLASTRRSFWFYTTVLSGAITSMIYIFLHSLDRYGLLDQLSGNGWIVAFSAVHAVPLTGMVVSYMFLFHAYTRQIDEEQRETAHKCPICGKGFSSPFGLLSHRRVHKP